MQLPPQRPMARSSTLNTSGSVPSAVYQYELGFSVRRLELAITCHFIFTQSVTDRFLPVLGILNSTLSLLSSNQNPFGVPPESELSALGLSCLLHQREYEAHAGS